MKVTRFRMPPLDELAGEEGFEPSLPDPGSGVLPLDDSPATAGGAYAPLQSKSSPLPGLLNTIIPLNLPQKAARIGRQIQSLLSNPLYCLDPLCNESLARPVLKYHPRHLWPAAVRYCIDVATAVYNRVTDDGDETIPLAAPPTPRGTTPRSADETDTKWLPQRCRNLLRRWHYAN